jgi:hypothetical protein
MLLREVGRWGVSDRDQLPHFERESHQDLDREVGVADDRCAEVFSLGNDDDFAALDDRQQLQHTVDDQQRLRDVRFSWILRFRESAGMTSLCVKWGSGTSPLLCPAMMDALERISLLADAKAVPSKRVDFNLTDSPLERRL